jgi:hypothetical protein
MRQRNLTVGTLLLALVLSAWGNVPAAALCPQASGGHACCHAQIDAHRHAPRGGMAGMRMGDKRAESVGEEKDEAGAFDRPVDACEHCVSHSQPAATPAGLREAVQTKRGAGESAPRALAESAPSVSSVRPRFSAGEHSPPAASPSARHVLLSVFRI